MPTSRISMHLPAKPSAHRRTMMGAGPFSVLLLMFIGFSFNSAVTAFSLTTTLSPVRTRHSMQASMSLMDSTDLLVQVDAVWQAFPYPAAAVVCAFKASAADLIAQTAEHADDVVSSSVPVQEEAKLPSFLPEDPSFDSKRNTAFILYGALWQGLAHEYIFNHLYPIWFGTGTEWTVVAVKVLFNLCIQTTLFTLPIAYLVKAAMLDQPFGDAYHKYIDDIRYQGLLTKCFMLWGPIMSLTFTVVPEHWRVTFVAAVSFFWLIVLSSISSSDVQETEGSSSPGKGVPEDQSSWFPSKA